MRFVIGLDDDDEGGLTAIISKHKGRVRVDFGKPITWFSLPPEDAITFASLMIGHARNLLERAREGGDG